MQHFALQLIVASLHFPWGVLILVAVVLTVGIAIAETKRRKRPIEPRVEGAPLSASTLYEARPLLSAAEHSFLRVVEFALDGRARVFAKVRLADLVGMRPGLTNSQRASAFNRIQSKHVDFVLCELETIRVIAVMELDDSSHPRADRQDRDRLLDDICAVVSLPILRFLARRTYALEDMRQRLSSVLPDLQSARGSGSE